MAVGLEEKIFAGVFAMRVYLGTQLNLRDKKILDRAGCQFRIISYAYVAGQVITQSTIIMSKGEVQNESKNKGTFGNS